MSSIKLFDYELSLKSLCTAIGWIGILVSVIFSASVIIIFVDLADPVECSFFIWTFVMFIAAVVCQLLASVWLLKATKNQNRQLLLPWMTITVINVILLIGLAFTSNWGFYVSLIILPMLIFSLPIILLYYEELNGFSNGMVTYHTLLPTL